jgi:hypothetical protein
MVQSDNALLTYLRSSGQNYSYHDGLRCMIVQGLCGKRQFDDARTAAALIENINLRVLIEQSIDFYDK